ncbi:hypothetical protein OUZ56_027521 [Daphnia magna]|uniref:Uncharacterized protein n=1 Tax=Daphnia magna TaxID=35525 RepID=A0ABQ9ZQ05_9CRUS|nr:hypothetical protein OUZ56_027521 [Daphnia magna]
MLMEGYVATHKSELKVNRSCKNVPNLQLFFRLPLAKHWVISPTFMTFKDWTRNTVEMATDVQFLY